MNSRSCRQERKEEAALRRSPTDVAFDPAMVEKVLACGTVHAEHCMKAMQDEFSKRFKAPAAPEHIAGGEEREREKKNGKEAGKTTRRLVSVTKAPR